MSEGMDLAPGGSLPGLAPQVFMQLIIRTIITVIDRRVASAILRSLLRITYRLWSYNEEVHDKIYVRACNAALLVK